MQLCIGGLNLPDNPYWCLGILEKCQRTSLGDDAILHHTLKKHQLQLITNGYNCAKALSVHHCIILGSWIFIFSLILLRIDTSIYLFLLLSLDISKQSELSGTLFVT